MENPEGAEIYLVRVFWFLPSLYVRPSVRLNRSWRNSRNHCSSCQFPPLSHFYVLYTICIERRPFLENGPTDIGIDAASIHAGKCIIMKRSVFLLFRSSTKEGSIREEPRRPFRSLHQRQIFGQRKVLDRRSNFVPRDFPLAAKCST